MKKQLLTYAGVLLGLVAMASLSFAGDFHTGGTLKCSDCHVMHYSQTHGYNADGTGSFTPLGLGGPYTYLLRDEINEMCLACHDGQNWAPDVFEAHGNGYVRQAGALNEVGGNGQYPPSTGHTLNSTATAPGGTFANADGLNCANCHAVHGGNTDDVNVYRNLGGWGTEYLGFGPNNWLTYERGDVDGPNTTTAWVFEDGSSGTAGTHYGVGAIVFNEPVATESAYGEYCQSCHTDFHGNVGGTEIGGSGAPPEHFVRHPASEANIGAIGGGHSSGGIFSGLTNQVQVMSPTGQRAGAYDTVTDAGLTPSCMSCHKGHGNQNAFGLIYMSGTGVIDEQGDDGTEAKATCKQCHVQG